MGDACVPAHMQITAHPSSITPKTATPTCTGLHAFRGNFHLKLTIALKKSELFAAGLQTGPTYATRCIASSSQDSVKKKKKFRENFNRFGCKCISNPPESGGFSSKSQWKINAKWVFRLLRCRNVVKKLAFACFHQ